MGAQLLLISFLFVFSKQRFSNNDYTLFTPYQCFTILILSLFLSESQTNAKRKNKVFSQTFCTDLSTATHNTSVIVIKLVNFVNLICLL